jgi:hypothetical protein
MDIDKQIDSILTRFGNANLFFSDRDGVEGGDFAFDEIVTHLNYRPQNVPVLDELFRFVTRSSPSGTKRTLKLNDDGNPYLSDTKNVRYIGNEEFADDGLLVVELTLPPMDKDWSDCITTSVTAAVDAFGATYADHNGVIAVEIIQQVIDDKQSKE